MFKAQPTGTVVSRQKLRQTEWERYQENQLYKIQLNVDGPIPSHGRCRSEETVLSQLHIGLTFSLIFISYTKRSRQCPEVCAVTYLLTVCIDLVERRKILFKRRITEGVVL